MVVKRPASLLALAKDVAPSPTRLALHLVAGVVAWRKVLRPGFARIIRAARKGGGDVATPPHATKDVEEAAQEEEEDQMSNGSCSALEQWVPVAAPSPPVPALPEFKLAVEERSLPLSVYAFYHRFLSCDSHMYEEHSRSGCYNFKMTQWQPAEGGGLTRSSTFIQPRGGVQPCDVPCSQVQTLTVHSDGCLVMSTVQTQNSSPYCDSYTVQSWWKVEPEDAGGNGCHVRIYVGVVFTRSPLVRALIAKTAFAGARSFFAGYMEKVGTSVATGVLLASMSMQHPPAGADPQALQRLASTALSLQRQVTSERQLGAAGAGGARRAASHTRAGSLMPHHPPAATPFACPQQQRQAGRWPGEAVGRQQRIGSVANPRQHSTTMAAQRPAPTRKAVSSALPVALLVILVVLQALLMLDHWATKKQVAALWDGVCTNK